MSDHIQKLIDDATAKLRQQEAAVAETKKFINQVCAFAGMAPIYNDSELVSESSATGPSTVQRNAFYGKPLVTCVKEFLKMRERSSTREATLAEIMDALKQGSFDFSTISKDPDGQKRGVAIGLAKNSYAFHRLPNGDFGLTEWYPNVKAKKEKSSSAKAELEIDPEDNPRSPEPPLEPEPEDDLP